jgi:hypothetical protein
MARDTDRERPPTPAPGAPGVREGSSVPAAPEGLPGSGALRDAAPPRLAEVLLARSAGAAPEATVPLSRSQILLRLPVENVNADLTLHSGERAPVMLFVHAGEDVSRVIGEGPPFVPMVRGGRVCLVARDAIACLTVELRHGHRYAGAPEPELPCEHQRAAVQLRSGVVLEGELRWVATTGRKRTTDHLNAPPPVLAVATAELVHFVAKAHIAMITEL